ncbi:hypothetical protein AB1L42_08545 [Thalassoglobus sp. JC818]|uniref:hypothetical protein n=1 Tax=Thalassoglobus sp. JC818 TaxID=3232136 RepID=UPI0034589D5B
MRFSPLTSTISSPVASNVPEPVMKLTFFDRLSAGMIAFVLGLILVVIAIVIWWATTRPPKQTFLVPMEMVEISGGAEDGAPDETLKVESPEDPAENPSPNEEVLDEQELTEVVDNVVELADQATQQAQQVNAVSTDASGTPGSADGTGRRGLGSGPGEGGIPNEQRWFIRYSDEASISEYAKQLDFFGIEMGALLPSGQLVLLSGMSSTPKKVTKSSGKGETRLYMTWQAGNRKAADAELFKRAGVDVSDAILFHFYPKKTEQLLLQTEFEYAKRNAKEIRRTYFVVTRKGSGYNFVVTRQTYLR